MKRLILFFILLSIPLASAISTDLKESYQQGETLILEISGNILEPLSLENIQFKRGHVVVGNFNYDLKKVGEKYHLYAQIPFMENNYTLFIKDISTTVNGLNRIIDYSQNFTVSETKIPYSINPGFIISNNQEPLDFTITSYIDKTQEINLDFPNEHTLTLNPGQNQVTLQTQSATGFKKIKVGDYTIPIYISEQLTITETENISVEFSPRIIRSILLYGETKIYPFQLKNLGNSPARNLAFNFDTNLFEITPSSIPTILPSEIKSFNLSLKIQDQPFSAIIGLFAGNFSRELLVNITYTENNTLAVTPYLEDNFTQTSGFYCSELGGSFCTADEACSEDSVNSLDGLCCTGTCEKQESKETSFAWVGWLLAIIVIAILVWLGLKYKKSKTLKPNSLTKNIGKPNPLAPTKSFIKSPIKPKKP